MNQNLTYQPNDLAKSFGRIWILPNVNALHWELSLIISTHNLQSLQSRCPTTEYIYYSYSWSHQSSTLKWFGERWRSKCHIWSWCAPATFLPPPNHTPAACLANSPTQLYPVQCQIKPRQRKNQTMGPQKEYTDFWVSTQHTRTRPNSRKLKRLLELKERNIWRKKLHDFSS